MDFKIPDDVLHGAVLDRAVAADRLHAEVAEFQSEVARHRREAMEQAISEGYTKSDLGRALGKHHSRIGRILSSSPAPERAVLSPDGSEVTVALGSKESDVGGKPSDMISRDAADAFDTIKNACDGFGLSCMREVVPSPGLVDLNRKSLLVMGSPKVLPMIKQIMGSDPHLRFAEDERSRFLHDQTTGAEFRSPQDNGESADYAYLGRLPRPDGQGTFLYLAGIHAAGTHGVARYLVDHLSEIYNEARDKPFSMVVRCEYDGDRGRRITRAEAATEMYVR